MAYSSEVLADSPLVYWRQGEASGTSVVDSSGNNRGGSYNNSPTLGVTGLLTGDSDTAVTYNGTTQYAESGFSSWMNVSVITLEAVIKTTATSGTVFGRGGSNRNYRIGISSGKAFIELNTGSFPILIGSTAVNDGNPHHIAGTWDGTTIRLYVDGVADGTLASGGTLSAAGNVLRVAQRSGDSFFAGTVDECALYGTALSSTRIAAHATAAFTSSNTTGTLATTLSGATLAASGAERFTGTLASTLAGATLAGSGTGANPVTGTLAATLAGATLLGSGAESFTGSFAATLAGATLAGSGTETITGSLSVTLDDAVLVATSEEDITGTLAATLDDAILAAEGSAVSGASGVLEVTLDGALLSASGVETVSGSFLVTLDGATLVATGSTHAPFRDVTVISIVDTSRVVDFTDTSRLVTFDDNERLVTFTFTDGGTSMNLRPEAREFYAPTITTDPAITAWDASFDDEVTWVAGESVGNDKFRWLVNGPDFDPTGQVDADSSELPLGSTVPIVRASDDPEVIYRKAPKISVKL